MTDKQLESELLKLAKHQAKDEVEGHPLIHQDLDKSENAAVNPFAESNNSALDSLNMSMDRVSLENSQEQSMQTKIA